MSFDVCLSKYLMVAKIAGFVERVRENALYALSSSDLVSLAGVGGSTFWKLLQSIVVSASALLLMVIVLGSCSTLDERDECCEEVTLIYRYVRTTTDEYQQFVHTERHFLFDQQGLYVREVPSAPDNRQRVILRQLPIGEYTMVTVGNVSEGYTAMTTLEKGVSRLSDFRLALQQLHSDGSGAFAEAEELFWNSRRFKTELNKRHTYLCDMANIHCHLSVKVTWEDVPPIGSPLFQLELSHLTPGYTMTVVDEQNLHIAGSPPVEPPIHSTRSFVYHQFPYSEFPPSALIRVDESLRGHELFFSTISLRYLNDRIPSLQLFHEGKRLFTNPIDLTPIFHDWGWFPERSHEQIYRIELHIRKDGMVEVRQWLQATVMDWEDGGTFG